MANRERILDAARQVYALHGFRGATTRLIAQEAGVNEVTVFRLFGSKAQLIDEIRRAVFDAHGLPALPDEPGDVEAEVTAWCSEMLDMLTANRSLVRKMMSEVEEDPAAAEGACSGPLCAKEFLERYVHRLAETGRTDRDADLRTSMTMLMSALFGDAMTREMMPDVKPPYAEAPNLYTRAFLRSLGVVLSMVLLVVSALAMPLHAQQRTLSLEEAMLLAEGRSEAVRVARAGAARAGGQHLQARSGRLPQLNAVVQYQRTLRSQFSALAGGGGAAPDSGGIDFSSVGFGAANQWVAGLDFSQNLFTFGRLEGASDAARAAQRAAAIELTSQRALAVLDVAQAYYDAALAERLVLIADSTRGQTEDVLRQTRLARQVGSVAEFDLLRAQVAYQNTLPVAITARGARDVAFLRLKQLLDIPLEETVALATAIDETPGAIPLPAGLSVASIEADVPGDTAVASRSVVRQAEERLRAQEALVRIARAERYPAVALTSSYQRLFFPRTTFPDLGRFSENWTIGVGARVTLLSGGRVRGGEIIARADADDARARLDQVRELAALDARIARNDLAQAQATWAASQGTVEQAQRAYRIDQVRFAEGIATQTDLAQTRILLQQATANRATAARDLAVARVRLALISDLPLGAGSGAQGGMPQGARAPQQGGSGGPPPQQQGSSSQGAPGAAATTLGGMPQ